LILQVILGYMHHTNFKRVGGRTWVSFTHMWTGRMVIIVGMVNTVLYVKPASYVCLRAPTTE
jgi:hypothetical protein